MEGALIGVGGGLVCGAVAGTLLSYLSWWRKDLRDVRLRAAGIPLPSDRVFPAYRWPMAAVGALLGGALATFLDVAPGWAALSVLVVPLLYLPGLLMARWVPLPTSVVGRRVFEADTVIGKELAEAEAILRSGGWGFEVLEDDPDGPPRHRAGPGSVQLIVRGNRVVAVDLGAADRLHP